MNFSVTVSGKTVTARATSLLTGGGTAYFVFEEDDGFGISNIEQYEVTVSTASTSVSKSYSGAYGTTVYVSFEIYYNSGEYDSASDSVYIEAPPNPPIAPTYTVDVGTDSITLVVTNDTGATRFLYFCHLVGETDSGTSSTAPVHTFTGLTPGSYYVVNVQAINSDGYAMGTAQTVKTKSISAVYIHDGVKWHNAIPALKLDKWTLSVPYLHDGGKFTEGG